MAEKTLQTTQGDVAQTERRTPATREEQRFQIPPVDIYETREGLTVVVDMPGGSRESIDVRVDDNLLTIRGSVKPVARGDSLYSEFALIDYFRQFQLNEEVDQEKISAELKHGVLTIHLPKVESAKPKQIQVKVS